MSSTNDAAVPQHLINSGITDEPEASPATLVAARRKNGLRQAVGAALFFVIGGFAGSFMAHRNDNPTLVTVNGTPIDRQTYAHRCETVIANNAAIGQQVLRQMVQEELTLQYAAKLGVTPADAEVNQKFAEAAKAPNFADNLKKALQSEDDLKRALKVGLAQNAIVTKGVSLTEGEVQKYYADNINPRNPRARYYTPNAVQIAAVISDKEADIDNAIHDLARGASFAQVAQKYSKDKSSANAGVLPPIRKGTMNNQEFPGLEARLFNLNVGEQVDKIKMGKTVWLVRCIGRSQEATQPFDKVKEDCRTNALLVKAVNANGKSTQSDFQGYIRTADVRPLQPQYTDAVNLTGK